MDKQLSLLLAEDDLISRRLIRILIEKLGHKVNVVENGKKAFEAFKKDHYDVVLMDIQMPLLDGLECTRKIREYESKHMNSHVSIIAVTAHAMLGDKEKCFDAGMDDYITKPIEEKILLNKINKLKVSQMEDSEVGDIDKLCKLLNNPSDVKEIITDFLDYYPQQLQLIKEKTKENNFGDLTKLVHKLKGSVSNFNAEKVLALLEELEVYANAEDKESIEEIALKLEEELEKLKLFLINHLK